LADEMQNEQPATVILSAAKDLKPEAGGCELFSMTVIEGVRP